MFDLARKKHSTLCLLFSLKGNELWLLSYCCIFSCFGELFKQVVNLQAELSYLQAHLATLELPSPLPPHPSTPPTMMTPPPLSIADLPSASSVPATYDLSSLFDPMVQPSWPMQQRPMDPRQLGGSGSSSSAGGGDLQALARELLHRHGTPSPGSVPCSSPSPSQSFSKWEYISY